MTVSAQTPYNAYTYAGSPVFGYTFRIILASDLQVSVSGVVQPSSNYTISGVGAANGGSIAYSGPLTIGQVVELRRGTVLARATDYQNEGDFLAATFNADFDRLWMAMQDGSQTDARALSVPEQGGAGIFPSALNRINSLMGFDGLGNVALFDLASAPTRVLQREPLMIATAGQTLFTFSQVVYSRGTNSLQVFVGGLLSTDYTETSTTSITFTTPLNALDQVQVYGGALANNVSVVDAALITYTPPGVQGFSRSLQAKLGLDAPMLEDYGGINDGASHPLSTRYATLPAAQAIYPNAVALTDEIDGTVFQWFLNSSLPFRARQSTSSTIMTSRKLKWGHGSRFIGAGRWSGVSTLGEGVATTTIKAAAAMSAVIDVSDQGYGNDPTGFPSTRDMQNVTYTNFNVDGAGIVPIGTYEVRSWSGNQCDNITVVNTTVVGTLAMMCWDTGPRGRHFMFNRGASAWLGKNYHGWANSTTVDQCTLQDWFSNFHGCDAAGNPLNVFADTGGGTPTSANADTTCGIGVYGSRALKFVGLSTSNGDGPGLYISTTLYPVSVDGYYAENNSRSSGASRQWSEWFDLTATSYGIRIRDAYFGNPAPAHRVRGTALSRNEAGVVWENCNPMGTIVVDAGLQYNLINCDSARVIVGQAPTTPVLSEGGFATQTGTPNAGFNINVVRGGTSAFTLGGTTADGTGATYSAANLLTWRRIANLVFFNGTFALSALPVGTTGGLLLRGLPFTALNGFGYDSPVAIAQSGNLTTAVVSMTGVVRNNTQQIELYMKTAAAVGDSAMALANFSNTTIFRFGGHYITNDA